MFRILEAAKAACFRSLTIAWSYALGLVGAGMQQVDSLAALLNDPSFGKQVQDLLGADPKAVGKYASVVALITIASRLRGVMAKKAP